MLVVRFGHSFGKKHNDGCLTLRIFALLLGLAALVFGFNTALAEDRIEPRGEQHGGFFSFLPAAPDLKLPHIDLIPFWSDDLKSGRRAYQSGEYPQALDNFQRASEEGNMVADWYLGHMYRLGRGVPANPVMAYSYYARVAERFDPDEQDNTRLRIMVDGQLRVADYQRSGIRHTGLAPNPQLAARTYLRIATNYGHPSALYALGAMSIEGDGMAKNPTQGLKWLNAAVRKHSSDAAAYLAELYKSGNIVRQNDTRALMWYLIATQSTTRPDNPIMFARMDELRFGATEEVRLEAEARAKVWREENPQRAGE